MMRDTRYAIDFADLRVLRLVYEYRSFSLAAEQLDMNQSAVSYGIDKLRKSFRDPLFVRQGGEVVATDRCSAIVASAIRMLDEFEAIAAPVEFDPLTLRHSFTIACNYYERQLILPHVIRKLSSAAPHVRVDLINSTAQGEAQLKRSEADLLIGPLRPEGQGFYCRNLLHEFYVCIMDPANPLAEKPLTAEQYIACKHAVVTYGGTWKSGFLVQLDAEGLELNQYLTVPSPAALPDMLKGTDIVATVPRRIALSFGDTVGIAESPFPAPFGIDLVWTERTHRSPMHAWLRALVAESVRENLGEAG
jgi:DNA-binding transcriptional LysR family regulator